MELALVLAVIAVIIFSAEFVKNLPAWGLIPPGLAFFALSFVAFLYEGFVK